MVKRRRTSNMMYMKAELTKSFGVENFKEIKVTIDDFDIIKVLGRGTYGKVMLVEKRDTLKKYAMKSLRKKYIIDEN